MPTPNGSPVEQPSANANTDMDFSRMSDDDLSSLLDQATGTPKAESTEGHAIAQTPAEPGQAPVAPAPEGSVSSEPDGTAIVPEAELDAAAPNVDTQEVNADEDLISKASFEALQKKYENLQAVFGRQSNELGQLRAQVVAKPTAEEFDQDPVAANEKLQAHQDQSREIKRKESEIQLTQAIAQNVNFHKAHTPSLEGNLPGIVEMMQELDKVDPSEAQRFASQIYLQNPFGVFQMNKRYEAYAELKKLKAQVETLKKAPSKAVNQMLDVNRQVPSVRAGTGESSEPSIGAVSDSTVLAKMSDKELEAQLQASLKKER